MNNNHLIPLCCVQFVCLLFLMIVVCYVVNKRTSHINDRLTETHLRQEELLLKLRTSLAEAVNEARLIRLALENHNQPKPIILEKSNGTR